MGETADYRHILQDELAKRRARNISYSLRAFARDLKIPAPKLCQILKGRCGISGRRAQKIAERLGFDQSMADYFIALAEAKHGRGEAIKQAAISRLDVLIKERGFDEIGLESFNCIADWIHFAILETLEIENFKPSIETLAERLQVEPARIRSAVARLKKLDLLIIEKSGRWRPTNRNLATPTDTPSKAMRDHHMQMLKVAERSIENDSIERRDFATLTLAFPSDEMAEAKKMLSQFRREFNRRFGARAHKDSVYCLSTQLFPLTNQSQSGEKE